MRILELPCFAFVALCCACGDAVGEVRFGAGNGWTPFKAAPGIAEGSALDFSALRPTGAPAGRFGRVVVRGTAFEFERLPGQPQRFYGVNLCDSANFPDHATSRRFCRLLARMGYNAVRIHHHDAHLVAADGSLEPHSENFDRLDFLMAQCIENGLYLMTDLYVSRRIPYRAIGIARDGVMPSIEFKELVPVHQRAYENFLAFSRLFLSHVNAYTGRRYADEPALAWIAFINEGNLGNRGTERFRRHEEWRQAWHDWLAKRSAANPSYAAIPPEIPERLTLSPSEPDPQSAAFWQFLADVEDSLDRRVRRFFKEDMGCKALTASMASWTFPVAYQLPRVRNFEYVDDHFYIDHPVFEEGRYWRLPSTCRNVNPLRDPFAGVPFVAARRALDKPFTVSEFNYSGPGRFRGLGGILAGTIGALQGWSGMWRFAWAHGIQGVSAPETQRMDYFNLAGDPLLLASERATVCLFLRGDLPELKGAYGVWIDPSDFSAPERYPIGNDAKWRWAGWYRKIGSVVSDRRPQGLPLAGRGAEGFHRKSEGVRRDIFGTNAEMWPVAGDGCVWIDPESGSFRIATPRTAGGFAENGCFSAGPLSVSDISVPATVWASSLDGLPVEDSSRILLTHLTNVQNSGTAYEDASLRKLVAWGKLPHLMQDGTCRISLALSSSAHVYALAADGTRMAEIQSRYADGRLAFTAKTNANPQNAIFLYEIVRD